MNRDLPHSSLPGVLAAVREARAESFRADPYLLLEEMTNADRDELLATLLGHLWSPHRQDEMYFDRPIRVWGELNDAAEFALQLQVEREAV